jgi:hypothetical protein
VNDLSHRLASIIYKLTLPQLYAFEELALIAWNSKERRQSIFNENSGGLSTWNRMLKASLEILAEVKVKHQRQQGAPIFKHIINLSAATTTKPASNGVTSQDEGVQQLPVSQANIFTQKGSQHIPFNFVRSVDPPHENVSIFSNIRTSQRLSQISKLVGQKLALVSWPFKVCMELRAAADLAHIQLVVISTLGIQPDLQPLIRLAISRMFVMSAEEDIGLVQYDLGVWLNCLCLTLNTLEDYMRSFPESPKHTPPFFLSRKVVLSEQDALIKAIKLAILDVVRRFEKHLNHAGLSQDTADMCQKVWEMEGIL